MNKEKIPGFYNNIKIDEIIKKNIFSDDLNECANYWITDKGNLHGNAHNYTIYYTKHFIDIKIKNEKIKLLEIGAARGSSLKMWNSWFKNIDITSLDNNINCTNICRDYTNIKIHIIDVLEFKPDLEYNIIIDDGCHLADYIIKAYNNLWKYVKKGGYYIIEDIDACKNYEYIKTVLKYNNITNPDINIINKNSYKTLSLFISNLNQDTDKIINIYDDKIIFIYKI